MYLNLPAGGMGTSVVLTSVRIPSQSLSGTWVRLDSESTRKYCFTDGEAWSLAMSRGHTLYLQRSHSHNHPYTSPQHGT